MLGTFTHPWPTGPNRGRRDQVIYYQYRHDRAPMPASVNHAVLITESSVQEAGLAAVDRGVA